MPITLLVLIFLMAGCKSKDPVVVKIGSLAITESEFRRKLADVAQGYQNYVITPNGRRQFLDVLIREKIILAAAQASAVSRTKEFRDQTARLKAEEEERLKEGQDYLLTRLWLEELRRWVLKTDEEESRSYHRKYPMEVDVRHILISNPDEAQEIGKRARAGTNFVRLAKSNSLDAATSADGGKMPPAIYGEIIPELEDVVFRMKVGEIGGPIKSKFGYHILKKDGERRLGFNRVQDRIMQLLEKQKLDRYLQSIQDKFPVEVLDEQFK